MDKARLQLLARLAGDIDLLVTKPFNDHVAEHGCGRDDLPIFACPAGRALYEATPAGHIIAVG